MSLLSLPLLGAEKWEVLELSWKGPETENPFSDVSLEAEFHYKNRTYFAQGFYDGEQTYKIRFMPDEEGSWSYRTQSNVAALDGLEGAFECTPPGEGNHGPVHVAETFHFRYADGTPFYHLGTTAYAWALQNPALIHQTLETLEENAFNKIRMSVMPKNMPPYIANDPLFFPFEKTDEGEWDFSRFNVAFFQHLDTQIEALKTRGIEADVIAFHPYDKWGFKSMGKEANERYLKYLISRLAAYHNVWWSLANEYDFLGFSDEEWEGYFKIVQTFDPSAHLLSIHNGIQWYDSAKPYITHLSLQVFHFEHLQEWREQYGKPVIIDEFSYEGDVPKNWGNLTPEEMVNRFWTIYCRGGYATHGETYESPDNILWWSKGGTLHGASPGRLKFLRQIMEEAPRPDLVPFHNDWNKNTYLYTPDEDYYLFYYGNSQQRAALLPLPEGRAYRVEIIDAWNMTIETLEGTYHTDERIPLPGHPYMAIRARAVE